MRHLLEARVSEVDRQRHRVAAIRAASWSLTTILLTAFAACLVDYVIRFRDPGVRILTSLAVVTAAVWIGWRLLVPVLAHRPNLISVARELERRFPEMRHRLSSALAFSFQSLDDPLAGSAALRRSVVVETASNLANFNWSQVVDRQPASRAARGLLAVSTVIMAVCLLDVHAASIRGLNSGRQ